MRAMQTPLGMTLIGIGVFLASSSSRLRARRSLASRSFSCVGAGGALRRSLLRRHSTSTIYQPQNSSPVALTL